MRVEDFSRPVNDNRRGIHRSASAGGSSTLTGIVQSATGAPLIGVGVTLSRDGILVAQTSTEADGTFRFSGLPLGAYRLAVPGITVAGLALDGSQSKNVKLTTVAPVGFRYAVAQQRLLSAEETANRAEFYGVVSDASGVPLNGIKVQMAWYGAEPGTEFPIALTGRDPYRPAGSYQFLRTQGLFMLQVVQGDWPSDVADNLETARVPGREGQPITYEVNFQLRATGSPAQIDGVVPDGQPGRIVRLVGSNGTLETPLKADSSFAFSDLAPGDYRLELAGIGVIAADITLAAGDLFRQVFPLRSVLAGRMLVPPDGLVAVLYAPQPWSWTRQAPLDLDGSFSFEGLPAGHYRLEVGTHVLSDLVMTGENRLQLAPIDLAAGRHGVIRGRVADGAGIPKVEVEVTLRQQGLLVAEMRTAADGTYRFANLPAGTYSLEVAGGMRVLFSDIVLDGQREYIGDVLWALPAPRSTLQGHVFTSDGTAATGTTVRLLRDRVEVARTQSDSAGAFRFTGLPGGAYALAVGEGDPLVADIQVAEDAAITRDVILPPATAKLLAHYFLFSLASAGAPADAEQRLALSLGIDYLIHSAASGGFNPDEAARASQVTIIGDGVPASVEAALQAAGCQVDRLPGDGFALAEAFALLRDGSNRGEVMRPFQRIGSWLEKPVGHDRESRSPALASTAPRDAVNDARSYGVAIVPATVAPGAWYWQAVRAHHLTPEENGGNHHMYLDILDPAMAPNPASLGGRVFGARARITWADGEQIVTIDKPLNEPGTNFPMWKGQVCDVVALGLPGEELTSDRVSGIHTRHPDEATGNTLFHHSFSVTFLKVQTPDVVYADSAISGVIHNAAGQTAQLLRAEAVVASQVVAADETFRFADLDAGEYLVAVAGTQFRSTPVRVNGQDQAQLDLTLALVESVISGHIRNGAGRTSWLARDGAQVATLPVAADETYRFAGLAAGIYRVGVTGTQVVSLPITLTGADAASVDLTVPAAAPSLAHYVLFGPADQSATRVYLVLAQDYLLVFEPSFGFRPEEAAGAGMVTILAGFDAVGADVEGQLIASGIPVQRIAGGVTEVAAALAARAASGKPF